jgi:transcriptional regulator with PAS, ATPase and Fis domain
MQEKKNKAVEKAVRELVRSAFAEGKEEGLRELEEVFTACLRDVRGQAGALHLASDLDEGPVARERYPEIIGESPGILRVFRLMDRIADSMVPVLIQGESGTGKELVAAALHRISPRRDKPFVAENCAAIPETLLESELFGYKKGAFTGADRTKVGLFKVADGGTLFLDEIGDMSLSMQKKLLRVLQDGEVRPVGSNEVIHVDVRILSASNKNLKDMVRQKLYREDLFYRLNTITVTVPPLRDRAEDVPLLMEFFVERIAGEMGREPVPVSKEAMDALKRYRWPGNIRELENEVRRCMALLGDEETIGLNALSDGIKASA